MWSLRKSSLLIGWHFSARHRRWFLILKTTKTSSYGSTLQKKKKQNKTPVPYNIWDLKVKFIWDFKKFNTSAMLNSFTYNVHSHSTNSIWTTIMVLPLSVNLTTSWYLYIFFTLKAFQQQTLLPGKLLIWRMWSMSCFDNWITKKKSKSSKSGSYYFLNGVISKHSNLWVLSRTN